MAAICLGLNVLTYLNHKDSQTQDQIVTACYHQGPVSISENASFLRKDAFSDIETGPRLRDYTSAWRQSPRRYRN